MTSEQSSQKVCNTQSTVTLQPLRVISKVAGQTMDCKTRVIRRTRRERGREEKRDKKAALVFGKVK